MSSVDVLKEVLTWKVTLSLLDEDIKEMHFPNLKEQPSLTKVLEDSLLALEKLEKLKEWLIKSEDDFQLLRISTTGDKLKCWYLGGQFKILEEVRLLL